MAEVKVPMSEWETMKSKEALLKKSLKREKKLSGKLEVLNQEKIKFLKDQSKLVTTISKSSVVTTTVKRVSDSDIARHLTNKMGTVLSRIVHELVNSHEPFRRGGVPRGMWMDDSIMRGEPNGMGYIMDLLRHKEDLLKHVMHEVSFRPENLHAMFYGTPQVTEHHEDDVITTKGLDEVKEMMKEIAFKDLTTKAQKALEMNPQLSKQRDGAWDDRDKAVKDLKNSEKRLKLAESLHKSKDKEIEELTLKLSKAEKLTEVNNSKISSLSLVISEKRGIFKNPKILSKIEEIVKN